MLGNKKPGFGISGSTTLISRDTVVVGEIHFSGNLDVEGLVKGNIVALPDTEAWVRVVHGGRVEGDIRVPSIVINGSVEGNVHSAKHLELATKGVVHGDVFYTLVEMAAGSEVNGALRHIADPDTGGKSHGSVAQPHAPAEVDIAADKGQKVIVD